MKSGLGRLILHDGTELPIGYRLARKEFGSWCEGTLIGDLRSLDPGSFGQRFTVALQGGIRLIVLVTGHSDRHVTFVGNITPRNPPRMLHLIPASQNEAGAC